MVLVNEMNQLVHILTSIQRHHEQARRLDHRNEELPNREVERDGNALHEARKTIRANIIRDELQDAVHTLDGDDDTFRLTSGTRSVDDVRMLHRMNRKIQVGSVGSRTQSRIPNASNIKLNEWNGELGAIFLVKSTMEGLSKNSLAIGVLGHVRLTSDRMGRVNRNIGSSNLPNSHESNHHLNRTCHTDTNMRTRDFEARNLRIGIGPRHDRLQRIISSK